jgi:hypothetical protein
MMGELSLELQESTKTSLKAKRSAIFCPGQSYRCKRNTLNAITVAGYFSAFSRFVVFLLLIFFNNWFGFTYSKMTFIWVTKADISKVYEIYSVVMDGICKLAIIYYFCSMTDSLNKCIAAKFYKEKKQLKVFFSGLLVVFTLEIILLVGAYVLPQRTLICQIIVRIFT